MNHDFKIGAFQAIVADPAARRELLWLRAKEKDDDGDAAALERVDPHIVDRLRTAGHEIDAVPGEEARDRRERFARISDECYARHVLRLAARR